MIVIQCFLHYFIFATEKASEWRFFSLPKLYSRASKKFAEKKKKERKLNFYRTKDDSETMTKKK